MEKELIPLISSSEIAQTVKQLAQAINQDYENCSVTVIGILKGSFIFFIVGYGLDFNQQYRQLRAIYSCSQSHKVHN